MSVLHDVYKSLCPEKQGRFFDLTASIWREYYMSMTLHSEQDADWADLIKQNDSEYRAYQADMGVILIDLLFHGR